MKERKIDQKKFISRMLKVSYHHFLLLFQAVEGLLDGLSTVPNDPELMLRYRDCHLLVLKGLQDHRAYGPQWTNKQVTRCLIECREECKYNLEAVDVLIRSHLVNMQQYDLHLAQVGIWNFNYRHFFCHIS